MMHYVQAPVAVLVVLVVHLVLPEVPVELELRAGMKTRLQILIAVLLLHPVAEGCQMLPLLLMVMPLLLMIYLMVLAAAAAAAAAADLPVVLQEAAAEMAVAL
jgi:hypothetical protein